MVMTSQWRSVHDELPLDDVPVLVHGKYTIDGSNCYEMATFRRSLGWDVSHIMDVYHWCGFDPIPDAMLENSPTNPMTFNKWFNPGE